MKKILFSLFILTLAYGQILTDEYYDITAFLLDIESGNVTSVQKELPKLQKAYPNDPNILLLDALLTTDGISAINKYSKIFNEYPTSRYADLALYRVYCYYFINEDYANSNIYFNKFKEDYPNSQYFKSCRYINLPKNANTTPPVSSKDENKKNNTQPKNLTTYEIQMAAFSMKENAEKLSNSLKNQGYTTKLINKNELTAVILIYQTDNESKLNALLDNLSKQYKLSPKILK
ncbi:MAG TPA: SPOR domain-containing protein [Ignavibacteriales bacterium]|nr:SPOR domain-containing protein [Ignavibacteriales bacterium]HOL80135.1 SPOR domain-containing protein [Ignavibacteriales bacterium]HOM65074.1 SPOR domain-containing protein [Ignavibacteriales bacterium]HPD67903.1 SPOR domain-containing protein [Ignavibacteriales bacterium]HPP32324.1 SPOR domain-containing protein [Ignavibacteriales bacterium]